jgi:hypothetical protein
MLFQTTEAQKLAVLKYEGGGDWYSNPTSLTNLIAFCNSNINTKIDKKYEVVKADDLNLNEYPFIHITGHGNIVFNDTEIINLRRYLLSGGFIHIDDNYGLKPYVEREIKKIFPDKYLKEIPINHPIYNIKYPFPQGLPKIHEHDNKKPQAMGLFQNDRLILLFTYECDLGDGWEDPEVHNDPEYIRFSSSASLA